MTTTPRHHGTDGGFTLLEVLLAVTITAIVMTTVTVTFTVTLQSRQVIDSLSESTEAGPRIINLIAGINDDDTKADGLRQMPVDDGATLGKETARGVLGVEAHLDRRALEPDRFLRGAKKLALRDSDLLFDQIQAREALGDGVLHL